MKKWKIWLLSLVCGVGVLSCAGVARAENNFNPICDDQAGNSEVLSDEQKKMIGCSGEMEEGALKDKIGHIIATALMLAGWLAVAVLVYAGVQFITAGGDANKIANAKEMMKYAVIGVIVALLAQAVVDYILKYVLT